MRIYSPADTKLASIFSLLTQRAQLVSRQRSPSRQLTPVLIIQYTLITYAPKVTSLSRDTSCTWDRDKLKLPTPLELCFSGRPTTIEIRLRGDQYLAVCVVMVPGLV